MVLPPVGQPVDQPRVPVVGEDHRPVLGEQRVELDVRQAVRVLPVVLQAHEVDDVDDAHLQVGEVPAQDVDGRQRLHASGRRRRSANTTSGSPPRSVLAHSQMPMPLVQWTIASSMVRYCSAGCLPATMTLTYCSAAQAVVGHREQGVRVRRQVDPHDLGLLVDDVVDEARVLVAEAVVVLPPHVRGQQVVQRGDRAGATAAVGGPEPLGVLVEHRVDDVDERLVAAEEAVPAGEQVALEPALTGVLGEDLHDPAVGRRGGRRRHASRPCHVRSVASRTACEPVGVVLVGREHAEVPCSGSRVMTSRRNVPEHPRRLDRPRARVLDLDRVLAEVGHPQVAQQHAAVGVRVGAHPAVARRRQRADRRDRLAVSSNSSSGR